MLLDEQIRRNKRATVRLFFVMFIFLWAAIFTVAYLYIGHAPISAGFALLFGIGYLSFASGGGTKRVLKAARARPVNLQVRAEKLLDHRVEEMAIAAGLPKPGVYVQDSQDINAFAAGRTPEEGVICVTTGALALLDQEELQGVIAHEMAHIQNHDIKLATYAVACIGLIAMLAEMFWWGTIFGRGNRRDGNGQAQIIMFLVGLALMILGPILSRLTYLAISRKREYLADATGAQLSRNPEGLASALEKISGMEPKGHRSDRTVASLYLANPFKRVRKESLWSTHPPIEERIRRLRRQA